MPEITLTLNDGLDHAVAAAVDQLDLVGAQVGGERLQAGDRPFAVERQLLEAQRLGVPGHATLPLVGQQVIPFDALDVSRLDVAGVVDIVQAV